MERCRHRWPPSRSKAAMEQTDFRTWTTALIAPDPRGPISPRQAVTELADFLDRLVRDRRVHPGDDLLSDLVMTQDDDDCLTDQELTSLAFLLLWAGYENSLNMIGNAVLALLQHPDQAAALTRPDHTGHDDLPEAAVEELLRYAHPNQVPIRRFPTRDLTIHGTSIRCGDTVLLAGAAIHRDPDHFPDPDRLDLTRSPNPHLAFGHGIHHCLGAPLARLHFAIAISVLFRRLPDLALAVPVGELSWRPSWRSRALRTLPIRAETTTPRGSSD